MSGAVRLIRAEAFRRMPWKNGGGVTAEIAAFPDGAALDAFGWRVSTAQVSQDGPFSRFPGVERTLAVLTGRGLRLMIEARPAHVITSDSAPYTFPADVPTQAALIDGPIEDLNVMTRRGAWRHEVTRETLGGSRRVHAAQTHILYCQSGEVVVRGAGVSHAMRGGDAVIAEGAPIDISGMPSATLIHIVLERSV
jgi:environmental stress-induced protein Ves